MSSSEEDDDVAEVDVEEIDDDDDDAEVETNQKHKAVVAQVEEDSGQDDDEEEGMTVKSTMSNDTFSEVKTSTSNKRKKPCPPVGKKMRQPAVMGLTIPFRATKRTMKLDPDIATVQNEAAILTTLAAELFVKRLATESHVIAKGRGRNTIRYEDLAETRTKDPALAFLKIVLP